VDLLELATLFCLYVVNNLPLAFVASGMLRLAAVDGVACCDVVVVISSCPCLRTT